MYLLKQIILLGVLTVHFAAGQVPYVSPGIGASWDLDGQFILSPKVSIGLLAGGYFMNLTIGGTTGSHRSMYPNTFVELQGGRFFAQDISDRSICVGGGIGFTIPSDESRVRFPFRLTAFAGFIAFANATLLFDDTTATEIGSQIVVPIPLGSVSM